MPRSAPPPVQQWPLCPDARVRSNDWASQLLALQRHPGHGKISGLSLALGHRLQVDPLLVRALFVIATLGSGFGLFIYGAGWALTTDVRTGTAPLDRLGTGWHELSPRTVVGWAAALSTLGALSLSSAAGTSWLALGVLALTIWLGWRARNHPTRHLHPPVPQPLGAQVSGRAARPARPTMPLTLITLGVAFLAGVATYETWPSQPWLAFALALGIVGAGLLVVAARGFSALLVVAGLGLGLGLLGSLSRIPTIVTTEHNYYISDQAELSDRTMSNMSASLDLTGLDVSADETWQLTADSSVIQLVIPADENIIVQVEHVDSLVAMPDAFEIGSGGLDYWQGVDNGDPTLTIVVHATDSQVWVQS
ncbi:MAG: PspC domain-containing protein [Brooklawnia sp.]|jgi:phage shock protein PspC (stress-responsive transcriptional regulator)